MADNRIRVKLTPINVVPTGGTLDRKTPNVVGVKVTFTRKGKGATLATDSPQPATLSFFEVPGSKKDKAPDANTTPRLFATLQGSLRLDNEVPVFDLQLQAIAYQAFVRDPRPKAPAPALSSDFRLRLELPSPDFENQGDIQSENRALFLPWEFEGENQKLEVDVELQIAGQIEAPLGSNGQLDVPLAHAKVLSDGRDQPARSYFGVGTVYALANETFARFKVNGQLKMPNRSININLHRSIDTRAASITTVAQNLTAIFADAQITAVVNVSLPDSAAATAGFTSRRFSQGTAFMATNCANLDAPLVGDGATLPFFDYWVFLESRMNTVSSESALAEGMLALIAANATKRVLSPIQMLAGTSGGSDRPFEAALSGVSDKDMLIANIVAHEIGHSLGLLHGLFLQNETTFSLLGGGVDRTRGIMTDTTQSGGQVVMKRLSPVDKAVLKRDYF